MGVTEEGIFLFPNTMIFQTKPLYLAHFIYLSMVIRKKYMIDNQLIDQPVCPFYFWTAAMIPPGLWTKYKTGW